MNTNEQLVEAAAFDNTLHARLAAGFLADSDIPVLIDSSEIDDPFRNAGGRARIRLLVPLGRADEARDVISDAMAAGEPDSLDPDIRLTPQRPIWMSAVALLLVVAMAFAAVPAPFRIPTVALVVGAGYAWWRRSRAT